MMTMMAGMKWGPERLRAGDGDGDGDGDGAMSHLAKKSGFFRSGFRLGMGTFRTLRLNSGDGFCNGDGTISSWC